MKLNNVRAWSLAALLGTSAINHMANPKFYYPVVPPVLCTDKGGALGLMTRHQWVLASAAPALPLQRCSTSPSGIWRSQTSVPGAKPS